MEEETKEDQEEITFDRCKALLAIYTETEARIRAHREILWQETRHFSWLITIIIATGGYILAKYGEFESIVWVSPILFTLSACVGVFGFKVIGKEREEFLRAVMVLRKTEKILGLYEPIKNRELSQDKGFSGYLFRSDHIEVFKKAEELWLKRNRERGAEQLWIEWIMEKEPAPIDKYRRLLFVYALIFSIFGFIYSVYFLWFQHKFNLSSL